MRREGGEHVLREVERGEGEHVRAQSREVEDLVRLTLGQVGRVGRVLVEPPLQAVHEPQVEGVELLAVVWRARDALEVETAQPLNLDLRAYSPAVEAPPVSASRRASERGAVF